jgi:hypothetical protein
MNFKRAGAFASERDAAVRTIAERPRPGGQPRTQNERPEHRRQYQTEAQRVPPIRRWPGQHNERCCQRHAHLAPPPGGRDQKSIICRYSSARTSIYQAEEVAESGTNRQCPRRIQACAAGGFEETKMRANTWISFRLGLAAVSGTSVQWAIQIPGSREKMDPARAGPTLTNPWPGIAGLTCHQPQSTHSIGTSARMFRRKRFAPIGARYRVLEASFDSDALEGKNTGANTFTAAR